MGRGCHLCPPLPPCRVLEARLVDAIRSAADDVMQASSWREQAELDKALARMKADRAALQVGVGRRWVLAFDLPQPCKQAALLADAHAGCV